MISVLFFARIREQLDCSGVQLEAGGETDTVSAVQRHLGSIHGPHWSSVLGAESVLRAVNQQMVDPDHPVNDGDEVAFFPPVTGG